MTNAAASSAPASRLALAAGCLATPALAAPPANDDFANAHSLGTAMPLGTQYTLEEATDEVFEQHPQGGLGNSIWYSWTAPKDGRCRSWRVRPTARSTTSSVYEGSSLSAPSGVQRRPGAVRRWLGVLGVAGTTYRIQVEGAWGFTTSGPARWRSTCARAQRDDRAAGEDDQRRQRAGNVKPTGLTFYGFDWSGQPAQGKCPIDGRRNAHEVLLRRRAGLDRPGGRRSHAEVPRAGSVGLLVQPGHVDDHSPGAHATVAGHHARDPGRAVRSGHEARPAHAAREPTGPVGPVVPTAPACSGKPVLKASTKLSLRTLRRRGARLTFVASRACPVTFTVTVAGHKGTLASKKGVTSGSAVTIKPSRAALKRLHVRRGAHLQVTATNAASARTSITVRVTA